MRVSTYSFIGEKLRPVEVRLLAKALLGIRRRKIVLEDGATYLIDPVSNLGLTLLKEGAYEPVMTAVISDLLREGDTFVDLGSNEGYFAVMAGRKVGERGKVIAIEPQNRLLEIIRQNAGLNQIVNVVLKPFGVGSSRGSLTLQLYPSTNTGASSFAPGFNFKVSAGWIRKKIYGTQQSEIILLDDLLPEMGNEVRLIKIDIEGFELEALKGASVCLQKRVFEHLLIETHAEALAAMGQSVEEMDALLVAHGYTRKALASNLNLYSRS